MVNGLRRPQELLQEREQDFPDNLLEARDLLVSMIDSGKSRGEACALLAEVLFWLGEYAAEPEHQEEFFGEGVRYGRLAVQHAPGSCAAHLWYAANLGSHGVARGIMASLSYMGDLEKHGRRALELDRTYFHAAPLRLLGRFYHQAPGFPIGPGDLRKAMELLEEAVRLGPEFPLNHLFLAEACLARRKRERARELLEGILAAPPPEDFPDYHAIVQQQAREMLERLR